MRIVLLLLLLGWPLGLWAQQLGQDGMPKGMTDPDSLWAWVHRPGLADTTRVTLLNAAAANYTDRNLDSAFSYSAQAVRLARRIHFSRGLLRALNNQAAVYYYASDYPAAQRGFEQLLQAARAVAEYETIGNAYLGLGNVAHELHNEPASQAYFAQAQQAYASCTPRNKLSEILVLYNRVNGYLDVENTTAARPLLRQAFSLASSSIKITPKWAFAANLWLQLGTIQQLEHHPDSALATWQHAAGLAHTTHYLQAEATARQQLAELAQQQRQYPQALAHAQAASRLLRTLGDPERLAEALQTQARALAALHQPGAYDTLVRAGTLRDTLYNQQRLQAVADAQARFSQAEQQARIRALEQQRRIATLEATQRRFRSQVELAALGGVALLLLGLGWWAYRRRQAAREATLRARIAADLHDDVGSLLTQISLETELLRDGLYTPAEQPRQLGRLADTSRTAVRHMNDVVWGLDARHDSMADLLDRLRDHAAEVLPPTGLEAHFAVAPDVEDCSLALPSRQALYLIYKEALHNVVKHAHGATQARVTLQRASGTLLLTVADNGQPAPTVRPGTGHGLTNMARRAAAAGGTLRSGPAAEGGWQVEARLPLE
jgi:signal transduction histidine kinase